VVIPSLRLLMLNTNIIVVVCSFSRTRKSWTKQSRRYEQPNVGSQAYKTSACTFRLFWKLLCFYPPPRFPQSELYAYPFLSQELGSFLAFAHFLIKSEVNKFPMRIQELFSLSLPVVEEESPPNRSLAYLSSHCDI
jgi:hypothetical protein